MSNQAKRIARSGFTLVEIVAALGAFSIAFLAGFAAIGALMIRQDINYRATVAGSAAMMFLKKNDTKGYDAVYVGNYMNSYAIPTGTKFRGYPVADAAPSGNLFTFKTGTVNGVELAEYRAVLMTVGGGKLSFWYGAPEEIEATPSRATTLDFLGGYAY
jgi:prepilin-type N-terminal cleavage/methylation domain-containing protein